MDPTTPGRPSADVEVAIAVACCDDRGTRHEIDTVFSYAAADPFAVAMSFPTAAGAPVWTFGRDLLLSGTRTKVGHGDVQVAPSVGQDGRALVTIDLHSPDGHLELLVDRGEVDAFLTRTSALVAPGTESERFDADRLISQLFTR